MWYLIVLIPDSCTLAYFLMRNGRGWRRETGLSPPVKYFFDRSKTVLLLWIFYVFFCLVFAMSLCASVYMCIVVTSWERAELLALVCVV